MSHPRSAVARLQRLIEHFPVVVLAGARQVGKSTLLRERLGPQWPILTLDPAIDVGGARSDPDLLLSTHPDRLVVDEVQYAPELVSAIKRGVDRDRRPGRFVLSGSQQWNVLRSMAESLAGRAVFLDLSGFTLQEQVGLGAGPGWFTRWLNAPEPATLRGLRRLPLNRSVDELLFRGTLPDATLLPLDVLPDYFAGYRRTYIERDVRLLANVADPQLFGRFLGLAAALSAQETNHSQLGRELGLSPPTSARWLAILEGSYQWFTVPAWSRNTLKRVSERPRGYIADTGLACASQLLASPAAVSVYPRRGALYETAVVADLRAQVNLLAPRPQLWHWRAHSGAEVDLVVEWNGRLHPVEVKLHSHPGKDAARGIERFIEAHPHENVATGLVIAPVDAPYPITDHVWAVPWDVQG